MKVTIEGQGTVISVEGIEVGEVVNVIITALTPHVAPVKLHLVPPVEVQPTDTATTTHTATATAAWIREFIVHSRDMNGNTFHQIANLLNAQGATSFTGKKFHGKMCNSIYDHYSRKAKSA